MLRNEGIDMCLKAGAQDDDDDDKDITNMEVAKR